MRLRKTLAERPVKFGTFGGVFIPCTLTILGVIMFLRFGHVVGEAGLVNALIIVAVATGITTLTALSLSAIATNTHVEGGGAYFLISRSLGVEFGGAIGIVFYLAQAISVALYVLGFAEAFVAAFPGLSSSVRIVATGVNLLVFVTVFIGAGWTIRAQYGILLALGLSLVSFYAGAFHDFSIVNLRTNLTPAYAPGSSFFAMFALFFPAATGIMAGANMSGDLENPARSIPRGTLFAIGVTSLVYASLALLLAGSRTQEALLSDNLIMESIAPAAWTISLGIFAATLSSALTSMMGAPRVLQAFARDGIVKGFGVLGRASGKNREPRRAVALTFVVSQTAIMLGDLNAVAPIIAMFFMITYGTLNLATFYEAYTKNPSYRPRFTLSHWSLSLVGAAGCFGIMFLTSPMWALLASLSMIGVYRLIGRMNIRARWGDVKSGAAFERARQGLLRLEDERYHPKNWRPVILALSGSTWNRINLVVYGHWLTAGHGVLSLAHIIIGRVEDHIARIHNQERLLRRSIRDLKLRAFPVVIVAPKLADGIASLVQSHGIGGIRPNTVLIGWTGDPSRYETFGGTLSTIAALRRSIVAIKCRYDLDEEWTPPRGSIDVWWRGRRNGSLMLLLAHLLRQNTRWRERRIRLLRVIPNESGRAETESHLRSLITIARIDAEPVVLVSEDVRETIQTESARAGVVFLGFLPPPQGEETSFVEAMNALCGELHTVIFVAGAGEVELGA